jgi:hypothetical protein
VEVLQIVTGDFLSTDVFDIASCIRHKIPAHTQPQRTLAALQPIFEYDSCSLSSFSLENQSASQFQF